MELNNLAQQLKREIKELKNDSISAYLSEMTNDNNTDYSLWKATKEIKRPVMQIPPVRKQMDSGPETMNKKLNDMLNTWNIYSNHMGVRKKKEIITEEIVQEKEEIKLATTTEVMNEIKNNINPKKAPDLIS